MPPLGAHMSIAGGYYKAVDAAAALDMKCVQVFTKNNNQWRAKPISGKEVERFQQALADSGVGHPLSHSSYLINLASVKDELWQKSVDAFVVELERAAQLGIPYVVLHPGAHVGGTEEQGIERVIAALDEVHARLPDVASQCLLENTAGQGTCLGHRLEQLSAMIAGVREPERLGVCIDTCHLFAAGYPLIEASDYKATIDSLQETVGIARVRAIHLNDSKKPLGSRVDRHDHIGRGELGLEPFRHLLNDARFQDVPMYLETPKGEEEGEELDAVNLRTLRGLIAPTGKPAVKRSPRPTSRK